MLLGDPDERIVDKVYAYVDNTQPLTDTPGALLNFTYDVVWLSSIKKGTELYDAYTQWLYVIGWFFTLGFLVFFGLIHYITKRRIMREKNDLLTILKIDDECEDDDTITVCDESLGVTHNTKKQIATLKHHDWFTMAVHVAYELSGAEQLIAVVLIGDYCVYAACLAIIWYWVYSMQFDSFWVTLFMMGMFFFIL